MQTPVQPQRTAYGAADHVSDTQCVVDGRDARQVSDVFVPHGLYRRRPGQNARQQHDKPLTRHDAEREVGRTESGGRRFVRSSLRVKANSMSHRRAPHRGCSVRVGRAFIGLLQRCIPPISCGSRHVLRRVISGD